MFSQTDNQAVQNSLRSNIHESERNIDYLSERLKELELKARGQAAGRGGAPVPPPKDQRAQENGRGFDAYGQRGWQQAGPGIPNKSRQYTKLGTFTMFRGKSYFRFDKV
jgi:classical protein kinase C